ncbi:hypothetical protein FE257_003467 [Aspergillus nanangensis]|uniref:RING-type domain-containing protein n=1 Tax=Aspergillus nanangensis TaxID=2582783 RepID=A0AAD4CBJ3_ASPNN|nr:hypothetical protein FE257_003467 [Aspergillus nanangensis]
MARFNHNAMELAGLPLIFEGDPRQPIFLDNDFHPDLFRGDLADLPVDTHTGLDEQFDTAAIYGSSPEPSFPLLESTKKRKTSHRDEPPVIIDLTIPADPDHISPPPSPEESRGLSTTARYNVSNEIDSLSYVMELFPDICPEYVNELVASTSQFHGLEDNWRPTILNQTIVDKILEKSQYPKRDKNKAAPKEEDVENKKYLAQPHLETESFRCTMLSSVKTLEGEFPLIPQTHIRTVVVEKKTLYASYLELHKQEELTEESNRPYKKLKRKRPSLSPGLSFAQEYGPDLVNWRALTEELKAAREKAVRNSVAYHRKQDKKRSEKLDEEEQIRTGNVIECLCCCSEVPFSKSIPCNGPDAHLFCFICVRKLAETQIGYMRYDLQCMDTSGCSAQFRRSYLESAIGSSLLDKLESLKQGDEIQQAGLEGLESCPCCDYKAIYPPVEVDREFRCLKPECKVVSCRLCKTASHVPRTCEEAKKDRGLLQRHEVEEAMSDALIRACPRCKVKIIKYDGCNKMICSKCRCVMCYVCRKDITQIEYGHFDKAPNFCRTHDHNNRSVVEVAEAQKSTMKKILKEHPELTEDDVRVEHKVKQTNRSRLPRRPENAPFAVLMPPARTTQQGPAMFPLPNIERLWHTTNNGNPHVQELLPARRERAPNQFKAITQPKNQPQPIHALDTQSAKPPAGALDEFRGYNRYQQQARDYPKHVSTNHETRQVPVIQPARHAQPYPWNGLGWAPNFNPPPPLQIPPYQRPTPMPLTYPHNPYVGTGPIPPNPLVTQHYMRPFPPPIPPVRATPSTVQPNTQRHNPIALASTISNEGQHSTSSRRPGHSNAPFDFTQRDPLDY